MIPNDWNDIVSRLPGASLLQTAEWAEVKAGMGWTAHTEDFGDPDTSAALILEKPIRLGPVRTPFCFHYVPRGPLCDWGDDAVREKVFARLTAYAKERNAIFVKIDPEVPYSIGEPGTEEYREMPAGQALLNDYKRLGWVRSPQQIQFANTVRIDVTPDEETLLANMKQTTRRKVRVAERKGVSIRTGGPDDFEMLYQMYSETSARDGFLIREHDYYMGVWQRFSRSGVLTPLIAEVEGEPIAAVMIFTVGDTARYVYGMSRGLHREKMPNYLLQWEAIRLAKSKGCRTYDFWGAPDIFDENDRMWGVYQFKRGFGGEVIQTPGAYDLPVRPFLYRLFVTALPKFIAFLKRQRAKRK